jgi:arylsulfatase A-like enzyme
MADDHAAHAISAYDRGLLATPGIDRLADEGIRLDACFCTNAICSPSRAAILTGTYNHVNRVTTLDTHFDARTPTFASLLRDAGYRTALIGKWHLGHGGIHDPRGFDRWAVLPDQGDYHDPLLIHDDGTQRVHRGYVTDLLTDMTIQAIDERAGDQPFCVLLHHKAPHRPWDPDPAFGGTIDSSSLPEPHTLFDDHAGHAPAAREARMSMMDLDDRDLKVPVPEGLELPEEVRWRWRRYMEDYLACCASIDANMTRLLDALDDRGLTQDTIVVYTSDQGFFLGEHGWFDKRFMYEESLRMPFLLRYPRLVQAGSTSDAMAVNVDFAQTFLELADVPAPHWMQGRSLVPLLRGEVPDDWPTAMYYRYWMHLDGAHRVQAHYGVRTHRHKLVHYPGSAPPHPDPDAWQEAREPAWELFDLDADPYELTSVHDDPAYAGVRAELEARLAALQREVGDRP